MRRILAELDFPVLSSLGFAETDLDHLADLALADYFITMSPEPWTKDEVVTAFTSALQLGAWCRLTRRTSSRRTGMGRTGRTAVMLGSCDRPQWVLTDTLPPSRTHQAPGPWAPPKGLAPNRHRAEWTT